MSEIPIEAPITKDDKFKTLDALSRTFDRQFSTKDEPVTNSLVRLGDRKIVSLPSWPTGMPTVDYYVIGFGGFPKGRIVEVFGPESAGKTSLCLHGIACVQKAGGVGAMVDAEHAFDPTWAVKLGCNVEELYVNPPDCGEPALEVVDGLIRSRAVDIVVVDSVAALVPKAELEGDMGDANVGLQARLMSQAMRKLVGITSKTGVTVVFINQIREKIGVMYGSPETTTGGRALKFFSSIRLDVRKREYLKAKGSDVPIGNIIRIKAVKNKGAAPFRETSVNLMYDTGFDCQLDTITFAVDNGVLNKEGNTYYFQKSKIAVGRDAAIAAIREECDLYAKVKVAVEKQLRGE